MRSHAYIKFGLAFACASLARAHTVLTTLFVNDVNQGDGTCIRMPQDGGVCTHPIAGGVNSPDMACGRDGQQAVAFTCPAPAGSKLTFEFRMWADASQPGSIDPSHLGSTAIYLKPVSNMSSDSAAGPGWFKIYAEGYDAAAGKWATEKLIANHGLLSINLPSGLPTGYYLARSEIVTIQNVTNDYVDPQFYVGCAQLFVQGPSTTTTTTTTSSLTIPADKLVPIPGHVHASDPGLTFNIRRNHPAQTPYTVIGPTPFIPTTTTPSPIPNTKTQQHQHQPEQVNQTEGAIPPTCLLKNANWCGVPVPRYTDEPTCWATSADCFAQLEACYSSAPPTGSRGCRLWEGMCTGIQEGCRAGRWSGPVVGQGEEEGGKSVQQRPGGGGDDGMVDQPVPGGLIPPAANADVNEGLDGAAASAASLASTSAVALAAAETAPAEAGCKRSRRERLRRRNKGRH